MIQAASAYCARAKRCLAFPTPPQSFTIKALTVIEARTHRCEETRTALPFPHGPPPVRAAPPVGRKPRRAIVAARRFSSPGSALPPVLDRPPSRADVKTLRVIAFISQFALLAHHTEMVLGLFAEAHADEQQQLPPPPPPVRRKPQHAVGGDGAEEEEEGREAATDLAEVVYAACSWKARLLKRARNLNPHVRHTFTPGCARQPAPALAADSPAQRRLVAVRAEVDLVYRMLAAKMFLTLEAVAGCDAKHGDRLRLENYGYFSESVRPLVRQSPALAPFLAQAEARKVDAFHGYVEAQLEYGKLWPVMKLLDQLERVLQVATPAEVTYQPGCSTSEVKGLLSSTLYQAEKKIAAMFVRVRKHCGSSTLAYRVWEGITERASGRYLRMEELLAECYPSLSLKPSSEEFDHMFKAVHS
ncbi:MAG: hypothetical protein WDW38_003762 [Sanguina aurantia]